MGLTCASLSLYRANLFDICPLFRETDVIRHANSSWTTVLPGGGEDDHGFGRMQKLARAASKSGVPALLFSYVDDDFFQLTLYQSGKQAASMRSFESWDRMEKALCALLESDLPKIAFKWAKHCTGIQEKIALLEETLGAALLDLPEDPERAVAVSTRTADAISRRIAALRKRPNAYELLPVAWEAWHARRCPVGKDKWVLNSTSFYNGSVLK